MTLIRTESRKPAYIPFFLDIHEDVFPDLYTLYVQDCEERNQGFLLPHTFIEKHRIRIV